MIYGWMFLGAAAFFIYGIARPSWMNSGAQLAGFLAYDIVLIVPLINHFGQVNPALMVNLIIYTFVVVSSGLMSIYYLFINQKTRIKWGSTGRQPVAQKISV